MNSWYITDELRKKLSWKEQDFLTFIQERDYTNLELQRKLYIPTRFGMWRFKKRLLKKIKDSITVNNSFGYILLALLGSVTSTTAGAGAYSHAFTLNNTNTSPSAHLSSLESLCPVSLFYPQE